MHELLTRVSFIHVFYSAHIQVFSQENIVCKFFVADHDKILKEMFYIKKMKNLNKISIIITSSTFNTNIDIHPKM